MNYGSKLIIGGTIVGGTNTTYAVTGATAGAHSNLKVDGTLNVGGIVSCCGYILGEGQVNVSSGGAVYLPFVIMDHRDGNYAYDCKSNNTFPSNRYTMLNIQADTTISYGGRMYGYVDLFTQANAILAARHNVQVLNIVGPVTTTTADMSLIMLSSGGSMDITYDESKVLNVANTTQNNNGFYSKVGKTSVTIKKGATMGQTTMTISVATITESFTTAGRDFALPYNFDIILQDGEYSIPQTLVMYPGSTLTVASTASLTIPSGGKLVVLDGLYDHSHRSGSVSLYQVVELYYPYSTDLEKYGFSKTANFIVDGSLTVASGGAFGGYVQTGGTGIIEMNGTPSAFAGVGNVADDDDQHALYKSQIGNHAGRTERTLGAWLYDTSGNRITMVTGNTYCAADAGKHTIATYDYTLYTKEDGTSQSVTGETLNAEIKGSWGVHSYDAEVTAPTCVNGGYTTHTCAVCGDSYQDTPTDATGIHTYNNGVQTTAPTCTAPGILTYTCGVCSDSYNEDIIAAKIGDTEYTILSEAIAAAGSSDTIVLQANISGEVPIGKLLTINKNDCTVELKAADGFVITETDEANIVTSLIKIMATNIKAGDGLDLYFYILKSAWDSAFPNTQGQAVITREYADAEPETIAVGFADWEAVTNNGTEYYRFCYSGIAAKEMTDAVTAVIKVDDAEVSNTCKESVAAYAIRTLGNVVPAADGTSELGTALVDMLNYGAEAQSYFQYNSNNPANANIGDYSKWASTAHKDIKSYLTKGPNLVAVSVSAKNKLMLTFYFTNITRDMTATITYQDHSGNSVEYEVQGSNFIEYNGWLGVDVIGLAIADGRQVVSCEVKNGEEVVASAKDSVEGYIARDTSAAATVLDMLMRFVDSAYEYFH